LSVTELKDLSEDLPDPHRVRNQFVRQTVWNDRPEMVTAQ
jgi:hypothetical protein